MEQCLKKILAFLAIIIFFSCCKSNRQEKEPEADMLPDETTVTVFGRQIENSVLDGNPAFYNNAFDKSRIKETISDNSIVYSSFDTDFGKTFFEHNFMLGDFAVEAVNNGGDIRFVRYYEENGEHHIVIRLYEDFGLKINDYIVDTVNNELKIREGFLYDLSTSLTNNVRYNMLFDVMNQTDPSGNTAMLINAKTMLENEQYRQARQYLEDNYAFLHEYPYYNLYHIGSVYHSDPKYFPEFLDQMEQNGFDRRSVLFHKLLFYTEQGMPEETEETVNELISFTGDDPIYLFFYGRANYIRDNYEIALYCYENAATGMPVIWDLWYGKLQCYTQMGDREGLSQTLEEGKILYGLSEKEINEIAASLSDNSTR